MSCSTRRHAYQHPHSACAICTLASRMVLAQAQAYSDLLCRQCQESTDCKRLPVQDMSDLVNKRLAHQPARVYFRGHAATHYGGPNGTATFEREQLEHLNATRQCQPASVGEFWYACCTLDVGRPCMACYIRMPCSNKVEGCAGLLHICACVQPAYTYKTLRCIIYACCRYDDYLRSLLRGCSRACAHMFLVPIFDLTLAMHDSHHGSFGRTSDAALDCRHYCTNVVDTWSHVFYSMLIRTPAESGRHPKHLP